MPIYEYECDEGHITEKLISQSSEDFEKNEQPCTICGHKAKKIVSLGNFQLKGNWFKNKGKY